jgi:hypothetical protein
MRDYLESGDFSKTETGPVTPETDTVTFNGHLWQLLLRTSPSQEDALAKYVGAAYGRDFQWSWRNAQLQYGLFVQATEKRNDANRAVNRDVAVIVLNHLISMVDAFAAYRLEVRPEPHGRTALSVGVPW